MKFSDYLDEGKQLGTVYHFTRPYHIRKMIDVELLKKYGIEKFEMFSYNGVISLTRNARLAETPLGDISKRNLFYVRLNIDGDKLSNKYKIKPVRGFFDDRSPLMGKDFNCTKVPREWEENEEMVIPLGKTIKMRPYIKSITVSGDTNLFDEIKRKVSEFPVYYDRKFTILKEGVFRDEIDFCDLQIFF